VTSLIRTTGTSIITREGEVTDLDSAGFDDVVHFRAMVDEAKQRLATLEAMVDARIRSEMQTHGKWTLHGDDWDAEASTPKAYLKSWEAARLRERLDGMIPRQRLDEVLPEVPTVKAKLGELRKLASITRDADVRQLIESTLPTLDDSKRSVKVTVK
jgi:hypothetical protein